MVINNEYKLDNGLVVALQNTPTKTVAVKLRVNYGSSYEKNGNFIEHKLDEELTLESYIDRYNQVNADKIMKVANKYLPDKENGRYILCVRDPLLK
ncbi:hypothetical protein J4404_00905 [Candidatus Woesearchaeota archaeon]|nr:hypothetical protein [Candidatus Woesearchaeota archaeon]